jgi:hypothetical protein
MRPQRAAQNEDVFRRVNERVAELSSGVETMTLVCECADPACVERLAGVPPSEYEEVRRHGDRFFVAHGHEQPQFETVVDERAGYLVVAKRGEAGDVARARDPRSE